MRAFAKHLSVSPAYLSLILTGKRKLSAKQAFNMVEALGLMGVRADKFIQSAVGSKKSRAESVHSKKILSDEELKSLASWQHYAILGLANLSHNKTSAVWIAQRLGVPHSEALQAYETLKSLGYIKEQNGIFRQVTLQLETAPDVPSVAVRAFHRSSLELAKDKLEEVTPEKRHFTAVTLAIDPKKLSEAKLLIEEFKLKIEELLEAGSHEEVYQFQAQLFPLTKGQKK